MAMCDYYLCDKCQRKCFYDAGIAEYTDDGRYLLSGSAVDIAAICEECAKTHKCIVVPREASAPAPSAVQELTELRKWMTTPYAPNSLSNVIAEIDARLSRLAHQEGK